MGVLNEKKCKRLKRSKSQKEIFYAEIFKDIFI
jgi:hypothetical protein